MSRSMLFRMLTPLLLAWPLVGQQITIAEGSPGALQIVTIAETAPNAGDTVVLQGIELLPIEMTGRTLAMEYDRTRARRLDRDGVVRIELPDGGRLLRYQRLGGQFWGYLWIRADGSAQVALEAAGAGPNQLDDPFVDRIAVAADGRHAAIANLDQDALHLLRLDGGTFASTGRVDRRLTNTEVLPLSVMVGSTSVFFQDENARLWRCGLADGNLPVDVSPPAVPNGEWKDQMAMSGDGSRLVFLYGPRDQQLLFTVEDVGPAQQLPAPPSKYEEPGYLPEEAGEPAMLLDHAGSRLLYVDGIVRDELFLMDLTGALPNLQITQNSIFQPYIGVHILPKFHAQQLLIAIGDPASMDWYRADLTAAGGQVVNLTGTGSLQQPFVSGTLDPVQAADANGTLLVAENRNGQMGLRRLDPATGLSTVVQQGLTGLPVAGSSVLGAADLLVADATGTRLYRGDTATVLAAAPNGVRLTPPVHGPVLAATWVELLGTFGALAFYLPDGTVVAGPIEFGVTQVCATPTGAFVVDGNQPRVLRPGGNLPIVRPSAAMRRILSGAGA